MGYFMEEHIKRILAQSKEVDEEELLALWLLSLRR